MIYFELESSLIKLAKSLIQTESSLIELVSSVFIKRLLY